MQYPKSKSFNKGLREVPHGKIKEVKKKLMAALGVTSPLGYRNRRNGRVDHTIDDCIAIEAVFSQYDIKQPWGE